MRVLLASMLAISGMTLRVCGSDEDTPPPPAASAAAAVTVSAEVSTPRHGGTVVVAEDHAVEVVTHPNGQIEAWVVAGHGEPPPPDGTQLMVNVYGADSAPHPVTLVWDAPRARYHGRLVGVAPRPGPVEVTLLVEGRVRRGRVPTYVVVEAPTAVVEVDRDVHVGEAHVVVERPHVRGTIEVHAPPPPHLRVEVNAPPPPHLDVHVRTPGIVVGGHGHVDVRGHRRVDVRHRKMKHRRHRSGRIVLGHGH